MNRIALLLTILIIVFLNSYSFGQENTDIGATESRSDFRNLLREGNRQFNTGRIENAERLYRRALNVDDGSNLATYNLGSALYRQQRFDEAAGEYERAASGMTGNVDRARAYHNLGNSLLEQQKLQESIEAFKQSLRNNPNDMDTKYNLSYALNLLREQEEQQQNNQGGDDNQDQQDQDQDQQQQNNQDQDQQQQQDQNRDDGQQQQISREDAQRMLDAIAEEERELLERLQQREQTRNRQIERNW